jgi:hypothetical protein
MDLLDENMELKRKAELFDRTLAVLKDLIKKEGRLNDEYNPDYDFFQHYKSDELLAIFQEIYDIIKEAEVK